MAKIGLIGPSGSGKTQLAKELSDALPEHHWIIDGYIEKFQEETDLAVARYASYVVNMQIAVVRLNQELRAKKTGQDHITCGTLIDTSIYTAMNAAEFEENPDGTFDTKVLNDMRTFSTLYWFALLKQDSWNYDHVFYLPPKGDDQLGKIFDQSIDDALKTFRVECVKLPDMLDEQVQKILEIISETSNGSAA